MLHFSRIFIFLCLTPLTLAAMAARAAGVADNSDAPPMPAVPSAAEKAAGGGDGERVENSAETPADAAAQVTTEGATGAATTTGAASAAPAEMPKFDILEYAVEGNSKLDDMAIERAVTPFLGEQKTLLQVEAARASLERAYHDAGYLTAVVKIPEQRIDAGSVTLSVTEGQVERLRVKGSEYHLPSRIRQQVPELAEGSVPYFPQVQREVNTLNRGADLKATPVLKAGSAPGTVAIDMEVDDSLPLHGSVEYSNRQSANTTAQRLSGTLRYDNLWQLGHSASLTLQTSPQKTDEVRTASATYVMPSGSNGDAWVGYAVFSRSKLATLSGAPGLGLLGNTDIYGIRYAPALPGYGNFSQMLSAGLDYKDVKQSVVVPGSGELPTPVTYTPLVLNYNASLLGEGRTTLLDVTATHGLRGHLGASDEKFAAKRYHASAGFFSLRSGVQHAETFNRWTVAGKLETQLASGPLVSNEQYAAGGAENVRGYLEGERVGDGAVRWGIEARTPKYAVMDGNPPLRLTGLVFYEGAKLRTLEPLYPQPSYELLRGAGVGLRLTASHGLSFDLDVARAIDDADITRAGDIRVHSRLLWDF